MTATVAIVDYGSGNLRSAEKALLRAAAERGSDHSVIVSSDANQIAGADRVVLPGVGAFADCMRGLSALPGMVEALTDTVLRRGRPFLGICVGMQLLAEWGREHGDFRGLGWIGGEVVRLTPNPCPDGTSLKIPHIGWNSLTRANQHPLLDGLVPDAHAYFVHSYHLCTDEKSRILATTDYGGPVTAIVGRDNIVGTQFHPEKSQSVGLEFLGRFLTWRP